MVSTARSATVFSVDSEVGRLHEVIVHRPGPEVARSRPAADVPGLERAREEHDLLVGHLTERGVIVHHFAELLVEALDAPGARDFVAGRLATQERFGTMLSGAIAELVHAYPADRLAGVLIGGLTTRDLEAWLTTPSLLLRSASPDDFILAPLPDQVFLRDATTWIYGAVSLNPLATDTRGREMLHAQVVHDFHPMFRATPPAFTYGNDSAVHTTATVEGSDVAVVGHQTVLTAMGAGTSPQGIEALSQRLFETANATRVLVVELPRSGACASLDAALTQLDRRTYLAHPDLPASPRSWSITPQRGGLAFHENHSLFRELAFALQVDRVRVLRAPVPGSAADSEPRAWPGGFLALEPGLVLGSAGDTTTDRHLEQHGITVVPVVVSGLGRGRGGPRRLTCPISREA